MSSILKTVISLCILITVNGLMNGQNSTVLNNITQAQLQRETEQLLGFDDLLVNGKNYRPESIGVNGNPNFEWDERNGARLFIKGQCFVHVSLTLDIVSDQLVLNQPLNQDIVRQVLLKSEFVDSFYLTFN
jgi:hypothetical protein